MRFRNHHMKQMEPKMTSWKDKLALTAQRNRQEIVKAKLNRREMMRLGLLTAGGALIAKAGLSSRAFGQAAPTLTDPDATLSRVPASPPMPPVGGADAAPDGEDSRSTPQDMEYGAPDGTTPIDGATKRIPHQYFSYTPPTDGTGRHLRPARRTPAYNFAPQKFYELEMKEYFIQVHPDYAKTRFFCV